MDNFQHYSKAEQQFVKTASSYIAQANNRTVITSFLNPKEQEILVSLSSRYSGIKVFFDGGYKTAESKRAIFSENNPKSEDFKIALLDIDYADKFYDIYHSTILGSLIHNGIKFEMIGDIIHQDNHWQVLIDSGLADFVEREVKNIGKKSAKFVKADIENVVDPDLDGFENITLVSSLRLDVLISEVFNLSRSETKELIETHQVRLNYFDTDNPSYNLKNNDLVSVHGQGRVRLLETLGSTNRNKYRIKTFMIRR